MAFVFVFVLVFLLLLLYLLMCLDWPVHLLHSAPRCDSSLPLLLTHQLARSGGPSNGGKWLHEQ